MKAATCWALCVIFVVIAGAAHSQEHASGPRLRCDTVAVGGIIQGVLVNDSTNQPIPQRAVYLEGASCLTASDDQGRFEIRRVPPGRHRVAVGDLHYRRFAPVPVEVDTGSVVELELRLRPGNLVADCRELEPCALLLESGSNLVHGLGEQERLEETVWRTSIALAGWGQGSDWTPCADIENERVQRVLQQRLPSLAPAAECEFPEAPSVRETLRRRVIHRPTGAPARMVRVSSIEKTPDGATARSSFFAGSLWAEGWVCHLAQENGEWTARWCGLEWIS